MSPNRALRTFDVGSNSPDSFRKMRLFDERLARARALFRSEFSSEVLPLVVADPVLLARLIMELSPNEQILLADAITEYLSSRR